MFEYCVMVCGCQVMPTLLNLVATNEDGREDYIHKLNLLASIVRDAIVCFLSFSIFLSLSVSVRICVLIQENPQEMFYLLTPLVTRVILVLCE